MTSFFCDKFSYTNTISHNLSEGFDKARLNNENGRTVEKMCKTYLDWENPVAWKSLIQGSYQRITEDEFKRR